MQGWTELFSYCDSILYDQKLTEKIRKLIMFLCFLLKLSNSATGGPILKISILAGSSFQGLSNYVDGKAVDKERNIAVKRDFML